MKTILLKNGHEMYEEAFNEKVSFIIKGMEEKGCEIDGKNLTPDEKFNADFIVIIHDYDDMKVRDNAANNYVEYTVFDDSFEQNKILAFKFK